MYLINANILFQGRYDSIHKNLFSNSSSFYSVAYWHFGWLFILQNEKHNSPHTTRTSSELLIFEKFDFFNKSFHIVFISNSVNRFSICLHGLCHQPQWPQ